MMLVIIVVVAAPLVRDAQSRHVSGRLPDERPGRQSLPFGVSKAFLYFLLLKNLNGKSV